MNTTLVFLKSFMSRDKFASALEWVKAQPSRIYLPNEKLWVLDLELPSTSPRLDDALDEIRSNGWTIVGSTLWDPDLPLRGNEKALASLAELSVENANRANYKRT